MDNYYLVFTTDNLRNEAFIETVLTDYSVEPMPFNDVDWNGHSPLQASCFTVPSNIVLDIRSITQAISVPIVRIYNGIFGSVTIDVDQATQVDKLEFLADGIDVITITNAPTGTFTARHAITGAVVSGPISGTDSFTANVDGEYVLTIEADGFTTWGVTINGI